MNGYTILAFFFGFVIGVVIMALAAASGRYRED